MKRLTIVLLSLMLGCGRAAAPATAAPKVADLIRDLRSGTPQQQVAAADQLSHLGAAAAPAIEPLLQAMTGTSAWIDLAMMDALAELRSVSLPVLLGIFRQGELQSRLRAGRAFWSMGGRAREARPIIVQLTEDPEEQVRNLASAVLKKMDAEIAEENAGVAPKAIAVPAPARPPARMSRDWPGVRGPNRDGLCAETGLLKQWPVTGPKLLWKLETLGRGHSTLSIAQGRFFTTGDRESGGKLAQYAMAFDLATRKEIWATRVGEGYPDYGALSTPTVDGELLYLTNTEGGLLCLETGTGRIRWQKSMVKDFAGKMMCVWKFSESPLVDGDQVVCTPGAPNAVMAAFHKQTGALIWQCALPALGEKGSDGAAYSSAIVADIEGVRQYIQVIGRGVIGVAADTGRFLWGYNRLANTTASITSPIARGHTVFTANSYNTGSALLQIRRTGAEFRAEEAYILPARTFENHHGGIVLVGDHIYGGSGLNKGDPACLDFASGQLRWKPKAPAAGSACVLYADGHILYRYDRGLVILVEANPAEFRVKAQFTPPRTDRPAWSYPVIHDRKLYLRDQHLLFCYDLSPAGS